MFAPFKSPFFVVENLGKTKNLNFPFHSIPFLSNILKKFVQKMLNKPRKEKVFYNLKGCFFSLLKLLFLFAIIKT
jgi:hypothetical protein